jgi:hypothetical protein
MWANSVGVGGYMIDVVVGVQVGQFDTVQALDGEMGVNRHATAERWHSPIL